MALKDEILLSAKNLLQTSQFYRKYYLMKVEDIKKRIQQYESDLKALNLNDELAGLAIAPAILALTDDELKNVLKLWKQIKDKLSKDFMKKYFEPTFWNMLFTFIARLKKDFDYMLTIDGYEGTGKSRLALNIAYFYKWIVFGNKIDKFNITLSPAQVAKSMFVFTDADKHYETIVFDEGGTVLFSREALSKKGKGFVKIFKVARMMNWLLVVVAQNITWLDVYLRKHRITGWIHVYDRGAAEFVSSKDLKHRQEFGQVHFDVEAFLKKVKTYPFHFTDFIWDDAILEWYNELKKNYVIETINEVRALFDDAALTEAEKRDEFYRMVLDSHYARGLPYLLTMDQLFFLRMNVESPNAVADLFSNREIATLFENYIVHGKKDDPYAYELIVGRDYDLSSKRFKAAEIKTILSMFGLREGLVKWYRFITDRKKQQPTRWIHIIDYIRYLINGLAQELAERYVIHKEWPVFMKFPAYLYILRRFYAVDSYFKAYLFSRLKTPVKTKHQLSAKLMSAVTLNEKGDKWFAFLFANADVTEINKWFLYYVYEVDNFIQQFISARGVSKHYTIDYKKTRIRDIRRKFYLYWWFFSGGPFKIIEQTFMTRWPPKKLWNYSKPLTRPLFKEIVNFAIDYLNEHFKELSKILSKESFLTDKNAYYELVDRTRYVYAAQKGLVKFLENIKFDEKFDAPRIESTIVEELDPKVGDEILRSYYAIGLKALEEYVNAQINLMEAKIIETVPEGETLLEEAKESVKPEDLKQVKEDLKSFITELDKAVSILDGDRK